MYQKRENGSSFQLEVLHFNFGLRGEESNEDENFVRSLCEKFKIPFHLRKVTSQEFENRREQNIQDWARTVRLESFKSFSNLGHTVVLAHQKDDLAENILLRMSRGSSPGSLLGMSEWHPPFWRPFLHIGREELKQWLSRHNLPYRQDSSNAKMDYSRNLVRHKILPVLKQLNPNARDHLVRCASEIHDFVDYSRKQTTHHSLSREKLLSLPQTIAFDTLSCFIGRPKHSRKKISQRILKQILEALKNASPNSRRELAHLPTGRVLCLEKNGQIHISDPKSSDQSLSGELLNCAFSNFHEPDILKPSDTMGLPIPVERSVTDEELDLSDSESQRKTSTGT